MSVINQWIQSFGFEAATVVLISVLTLILRSIYDAVTRRFRLRHVHNILGDSVRVRNSIALILPIYSPYGYDSFTSDQKSVLYKRKNVMVGKLPSEQIVKTSWGEGREVPIFSDMIVLDDYFAFKKFERVLINSGYGAVEFIGDIDALGRWEWDLILAFGGPRSNQKVRQIIDHPMCNFVDIDEEAHSLGEWLVRYYVDGVKKELRVEPGYGYAVIFKVQNPYYPPGKIISIAGDTAASTQMAADYMCKHIENLSVQYDNSDFLLILRGASGAIEGGEVKEQLKVK